MRRLLTSTRRAGVLPTHTDIPPVAQTTMRPNLLHALQVITQLGRNVLRKGLRVFARLKVLLSIQEPERNFELSGILNDSHELFNLIRGQFAGSLVDIDFGFFANQIGKAAADPGDFGQRKDDIALAFDVGIENTQNVLEFRSLL
jgi:hypothetical protein